MATRKKKPKPKKRDIGKRIEELRKAREMSQQGLAEAAGVSISIVSLLERGANGDPRLSTLDSIAEALGVSIEKLIAEE